MAEGKKLHADPLTIALIAFMKQEQSQAQTQKVENPSNETRKVNWKWKQTRNSQNGKKRSQIHVAVPQSKVTPRSGASCLPCAATPSCSNRLLALLHSACRIVAVSVCRLFGVLAPP
jgi:hypothetical protein